MNKKKMESFRQYIRQIEREIDRQLKDSRICCGVSLSQCHLMMELGSAGRITISKLADLMKLDKSTLSRTIDGLVQNGLVERSISTSDRRFMDVELTVKGMKLFESINTCCNAIYGEILDHIPKEKHAAVYEGIDSFAEAMQTIRERSPNGTVCQLEIKE